MSGPLAESLVKQDDLDELEDCRLLGGAFALLVQVFLLSVVVITMYVKWIFEAERRTRQIWMFDSLKQGFGAGTGHAMNVLISIVFARSKMKTSLQVNNCECVLYFVSQTFDAMVGVPFELFLLHRFQALFPTFPRTGDYVDAVTGDVAVRIWARQTCVWVLIVLVAKSLLAIPVLTFMEPLAAVGESLLDPFLLHPHTLLVFVMIIWPAICNSIQFYVVDNFLKKQSTRHYEAIAEVESPSLE